MSVSIPKRPGTAGTQGRKPPGLGRGYSALASQRTTSRDQSAVSPEEGWKSVTFFGEEEPQKEEQEEGLFKKYWERERSSVVGKKKIRTEKVKEVRTADCSSKK